MLKQLFFKFDIAISNAQKVDEKNKLRLKMFLIECKFNLDILAAIDFDHLKNNDPQILEIINLLSTDAMEILISSEEDIPGSLIEILITEAYKKVINKLNHKEEEDKDFNVNDRNLLKLYKRYLVLKALTKITKPYTALKQINYSIRLKNINELLIEISKNNTI